MIQAVHAGGRVSRRALRIGPLQQVSTSLYLTLEMRTLSFNQCNDHLGNLYKHMLKTIRMMTSHARQYEQESNRKGFSITSISKRIYSRLKYINFQPVMNSLFYYCIDNLIYTLILFH